MQILCLHYVTCILACSTPPLRPRDTRTCWSEMWPSSRPLLRQRRRRWQRPPSRHPCPPAPQSPAHGRGTRGRRHPHPPPLLPWATAKPPASATFLRQALWPAPTDLRRQRLLQVCSSFLNLRTLHRDPLLESEPKMTVGTSMKHCFGWLSEWFFE